MARDKTYSIEGSDIRDKELARETGRLFEHNDRYLKTNLYHHTASKVSNSIRGLVLKEIERPEVDAFMKELSQTFLAREENGQVREEVVMFEGKI